MLLTKHHGLGNDFLVLLTRRHIEDGSELPRQVCARRTGIGADGLICASYAVTDADLEMRIYNADGSSVEMSGNGIRCLAQAEAMRRGENQFGLVVRTVDGPRVVDVRPGTSARAIEASVDMGSPKIEKASTNRVYLDLGNPHLVINAEDPWDERLLALVDPDCNTEFIGASSTPGRIRMRVIERAIGETQACGTGASAAAWAAR